MYEDLLMVASPSTLRRDMTPGQYRQFMRRVSLRPMRSLSDDLYEAVAENDVDFLDAVLRALAYPVWNEAMTLEHPAMGPGHGEDHRTLLALSKSITTAADTGALCLFDSEYLWKMDAAVRYLGEHRKVLADRAEQANQREWLDRLDQTRPFDFVPTDATGSHYRLMILARRMTSDDRHGIDRIIVNQQYREELEGIARHIPGHRTDDLEVQRNQLLVAELALTLGYHLDNRTVGMAVPAELTTRPPRHIVTSEATGQSLHGDPVVNLYLSEIGDDVPRGLTAGELRQWGKPIAYNVSFTDASRQAATILRQRYHLNRFGMAPCNSAVVIVHNIDDRGHPDEGRPLVNSATPEKLFGKTVDQLLEQSEEAAAPARTHTQMKAVCQALAELSDLSRSPQSKSLRPPDIHSEAQRLIEECVIEFSGVTLADGATLRLILHPHELQYSSLGLIRCSLVNQIASLGNPLATRWAGIVWQRTRRWTASMAA
jgi:hypothetical protein